MTERIPAILLLGPTGSGKTPLGQMFESQTLGSHRFIHFDFGEHLRRVVARGVPDAVVSRQDIEFLRQVLQSGALLEDKDFPIALRILRAFVTDRQLPGETILVLNGLPRHVGQAASLEVLIHVGTVVLLCCSPDVVYQRIATNAGGDRADRADDQRIAVQRKLDLYHQRTAPLIDYYRARGARVVSIDVSATMTVEVMWQAVRTTIK
jgi:adenylate kinase family enzyme